MNRRTLGQAGTRATWTRRQRRDASQQQPKRSSSRAVQSFLTGSRRPATRAARAGGRRPPTLLSTAPLSAAPRRSARKIESGPPGPMKQPAHPEVAPPSRQRERSHHGHRDQAHATSSQAMAESAVTPQRPNPPQMQGSVAQAVRGAGGTRDGCSSQRGSVVADFPWLRYSRAQSLSLVRATVSPIQDSSTTPSRDPTCAGLDWGLGDRAHDNSPGTIGTRVLNRNSPTGPPPCCQAQGGPVSDVFRPASAATVDQSGTPPLTTVTLRSSR